MNYFTITYGCQMNRSDSEKITTRLRKMGHQPAKNAALAELIVVNLCSVRESAVHRALDQIHKLSDGRKKIIAAGCILPQDRKKLAAKNIAIWHPDDYFSQVPLRESEFSVFVPIMTGCNNFCSYCAVPFTRGREKSRPAKEIIAEIKKLLKNGAKEIILLGQNVNSYKDTAETFNPPTPLLRKGGEKPVSASLVKRGAGGLKNTSIDFPALLIIINALSGNFRLSFITSHPKDMSDKLIETMAKCKKIIPYLHLPVQSGDDKILRAMNRHYSVAHYKNLIKKIHSSFARWRASEDKPPFSPIAISTDIIVGFPGETAKQFQNTLKLIKNVNFDMIYFARYSPRSGTAAAKLKDNVSPKEKRRRAQVINSLLKKQALELNKKYIGQEVEILVEKVDANWARGKTSTNKEVMLPRKKLKIGQFTTVKITEAAAWHLKGLEKPR
ncbi:MAG: MiaB/RimO family radical SAM methylthiotransferase [Candidatus Portnoybacteria bacterium]|nr:MiaB/RimO family radical SAM methylthiotransferase [Candidatus Portnoybacteria bacterium]MDD4982923.1 MiaB/RimO family radical SAM methylthiotransferase [Candidatus Portnoybacteria bacterium]